MTSTQSITDVRKRFQRYGFLWTVSFEGAGAVLPNLVVTARDLRDAITRGLTSEDPRETAAARSATLLGEMLGISVDAVRDVPANDESFGKLHTSAPGLAVVSGEPVASGASDQPPSAQPMVTISAWRHIEDPDGAFAHRIERRNWFVDGKYLGDKSPWVEDAGGDATAKDLTGDFYGEWQGARHFDGRQIVDDAVAREKANRATGARNHAPDTADGQWYRNAEIHGSPIALGDWGEYRVVTWPAAHEQDGPLA